MDDEQMDRVDIYNENGIYLGSLPLPKPGAYPLEFDWDLWYQKEGVE